MTYGIAENENNTTAIEISFQDEDVNLTGRTTVKGKTANAETYLPIFEADLRRNFAELFPPPTVPEVDPGEMI